MGAKLSPSFDSDALVSLIYRTYNIQKSNLFRIAFGLSINKNGINVSESLDSRGKDVNLYSIVPSKTGDEILFKTIIESVYGRKITDDEFFGSKSFFKYHLDTGCNILKEIFDDSNGDKYKFILNLNKKVSGISEVNISGDTVIKLDIDLGKELLSGEEKILELNNSNKHGNSHLAIMGKPGQGKTEILKNILTQIRKKSNYKTNFIFIDYKGDVYNNEKFIDETKSTVYSVPHDELPINPFVLDSYGEKDIKMSAREKADSFSSSITRQFGSVQKANLQDIIIQCYKNRDTNEKQYPDFKEVYEELLRKYDSDGIKNDTLSDAIRSLSEFELFWSHKSSEKLITKLHQQTCIIDLHDLPALKELVAYLIIEKLYKEMKQIQSEGGSNTNDGYREIKTILVIDEAHNYLNKKNIFLEKIIREGRSAGIAVFFASQSPKDYEQDDFNFKELLEFSLILNSAELTSSSISKLLGTNKNISTELAGQVSKLKPFQVLMKSDNNKGFKTFKGDGFFEKYN